jgi:hypothetical protein
LARTVNGTSRVPFCADLLLRSVFVDSIPVLPRKKGEAHKIPLVRGDEITRVKMSDEGRREAPPANDDGLKIDTSLLPSVPLSGGSNP